MVESESLARLLPYLIPFVVLEIALLTVALVDLSKRRHVTGGNKVIWVLVIVLIRTIGPAIYLMAGRKEGHIEGD